MTMYLLKKNVILSYVHQNNICFLIPFYAC